MVHLLPSWVDRPDNEYLVRNSKFKGMAKEIVSRDYKCKIVPIV